MKATVLNESSWFLSIFSTLSTFFGSLLTQIRLVCLISPHFNFILIFCTFLGISFTLTLISLHLEVTVTWAHHELLENNYNQALQGLFLTVILGIYFTVYKHHSLVQFMA